MTEASLMRRIMLALTSAGARVFRNNCGVMKDGDRYIRYGVANPGGSDLIGWNSVTVTSGDVGRRVAIFLAVEVKTERGRLTEEQRNFLAAVRDAGGLAIEARDVERTIKYLRQQANEQTI